MLQYLTCSWWQVRTTSKAFSRVQAVKGSEQYLRESGWRNHTADFTSFWTFEHRPATVQWECVASLLNSDVVPSLGISCLAQSCALHLRVLGTAVKLLVKAEALCKDKLERLQSEELERREKKLANSAERQRVLAQIKDDHLVTV